MKSSRVVARLALCASFLLLASDTLSQSRRALVIGNAAYRSLEDLQQSPSKDANGIASALEGVGFEGTNVDRKFDLDLPNMKGTIENFAKKLSSDDSVVLYFSGHGFSLDGENFLAPVDFAMKDSSGRDKNKAEVRDSAISLTWIVKILGSAHIRAVILDACRDEVAVSKGFRPSGDGSLSILGLQPGKGNGTLVGYSAGSGEVSSGNSNDGYSYYTHYLVRVIEKHPDDLFDALYATQQEVSTESNERQNPAIYSEMHGRFLLKGTPLGRGAKGELIHKLFNDICSGSPLIDRVGTDTREQVRDEVRKVSLSTANITATLTDGDPLKEPLIEIQRKSRDLLSDRLVFPEDILADSGADDDYFKNSVCSFRGVLSGAKQAVEERLGQPRQCGIEFSCKNESGKITEPMLRSALRRGASAYTVTAGGEDFHEWFLWLDLPVDFRRQVESVTYKFPSGYLHWHRSFTETVSDGASAWVYGWKANTCGENGNMEFRIKMRNVKDPITFSKNLCDIAPSVKIPD